MSYSDGNSYSEILARVLDSDNLINVDKREGSIVYDAVAPLCLELANAYIKMDVLESQSFISSCTGTVLESRANDFGLSRTQATYAQMRGRFYDKDGNEIDDVDIGTNFMASDDSTLTYEYLGHLKTDYTISNDKTKTDLKDSDGKIYQILQCEVAGTSGNKVYDLSPVTVVPSDYASGELLSAYVTAEDIETDDSLRERVLEVLCAKRFGGNIADYTDKVESINGVGRCKVYPSWDAGTVGSVLVSAITNGTYDSDGNLTDGFDPISEAQVTQIKNTLDPTDYAGKGDGWSPIGHIVTVTTPVKDEITVSLSVTLKSGYTVDDIQTDVNNAIMNYFTKLRSQFGDYTTYFSDYNNIIVSRAYIADALIKSSSDDTKGIDAIQNIDVDDIRINGINDDYTITDDDFAGGQSLPYLKDSSVTITLA